MLCAYQLSLMRDNVTYLFVFVLGYFHENSYNILTKCTKHITRSNRPHFGGRCAQNPYDPFDGPATVRYIIL